MNLDHMDFLKWVGPSVDIIVGNPPYFVIDTDAMDKAEKKEFSEKIAELTKQLEEANKIVSEYKIAEDKTSATSVMSDKISGLTLTALTAKNRFVPPFISADVQLNFKTGLSKYMGLLDLATKYGTIIPDGRSFKNKKGVSIGYASTFEDSAEFWENGPLQELDVEIQNDLTYSNSKYVNLKKEVDEIDVVETSEEK
jgi:hypothetical protein